MNRGHLEAKRCPEDVLVWLAHYPDGGLDATQRGAVESHAADCTECREELAWAHGRPGDASHPELPDADSVWARVLARIEEEGHGDEAGALASLHPEPARRRIRSSWLAAAGSLAAGIVLGLLAGGVGSFQGAGAPVYETASEAAGPAAAAPALSVVFREELSMARVQAALRGMGAEVVSGPSGLGVYRVRLAPNADPREAARLLTREGEGVARFAEPAPGSVR